MINKLAIVIGATGSATRAESDKRLSAKYVGGLVDVDFTASGGAAFDFDPVSLINRWPLK
jgi:hypothetical protein